MRQGPLVGLAAVVLAVLIAQVALAGSPPNSGSPKATASAVTTKKFKKLTKQFKKLNKRFKKLDKQVQGLARQAGPQGPTGPHGSTGPQGSTGQQGLAGTAPACQGNGSGDTMVSAGAVCIDRYEVSVWSSPTGGTQYGVSFDDYPGACTDTGQGCKKGTAGEIYARSVPGVTPSGFITYFQAQQALANVGKRLPSNAEWQQAVAGTPDPGGSPGAQDCNSNSAGPSATGSRANCVSNFGANDMVGNLDEWVADWVPLSTTCPGWGTVGTFSSDDVMCLSGASTTATGPGGLLRGGYFGGGADVGPFAVSASERPSVSSLIDGFRGAR